MKSRILLFCAVFFLLCHSVFAQQASSINPNVPAPGADVDSYTVRALALAAYNDITALMGDHNLPSVGADQYLGTTSAGIAGPFSWPSSCSGANQALIYQQGVGVRCNTLNFSGLGTVTSVGFQGDGIFFSTTPSTPVTASGNIGPTILTQQANCVFAGPVLGSPTAPSCRILTGSDIPFPATTSIGGVKAIVAITHQFITSITTAGQAILAQPLFSDLLGNISISQMNGGTGASSTTAWFGDGTWKSLTNGINALTGDVSASGTGSVAATVNSFSNGKTIAGIAVAQQFTKGQAGAPITITPSGGTYTPDFSLGNNFIINLVHASCPCTLANPINVTSVTSGIIQVNQSATGSDLINTYGSAYKFSNGIAIVLSAGASATDTYSFAAIDSSHVQMAAFGNNFQ